VPAVSAARSPWSTISGLMYSIESLESVGKNTRVSLRAVGRPSRRRNV
jgi:hypothetical protein